MNSNERRENETRAQYRGRRAAENMMQRHRERHGVRLLWDSFWRGTYRRKAHGPLA